MNTPTLELTIALRHQLHACPELSGNEATTTEAIYQFLKMHTQLKLERHQGWLLATRWESDSLPSIGFRADMDAIPTACGTMRHGCGHDGHSAILAGLALELENQQLGKNVHLIFQPAEETGVGAKMICDTWPTLNRLKRIYGLHNIPGHPLGTLLYRESCFACASRGVIVRIQGRPAHAAYPSDGANPTELISQLVLELPKMIERILSGANRLLMHTVVGLRAGGENFGMSAAEGELCLTLRAHRQDDIEALQQAIERFATAGCATQDMQCTFECRDVFPDTTNHKAVVDEACALWRAAEMPMHALAEPMRWSEDFGWYLKAIPGMFFGIGTGEDAPGLHTDGYEFDDRLIAPAVHALFQLATNDLGTTRL